MPPCTSNQSIGSAPWFTRHIDVKLAVAVRVHHQRFSQLRLGDCILPEDVDVTVQMHLRLKNPVKPLKGLNAVMRQIIHVVDFPGRSVGDKYIQVTAVQKFVEKECRGHH